MSRGGPDFLSRGGPEFLSRGGPGFLSGGGPGFLSRGGPEFLSRGAPEGLSRRGFPIFVKSGSRFFIKRGVPKCAFCAWPLSNGLWNQLFLRALLCPCVLLIGEAQNHRFCTILSEMSKNKSVIYNTSLPPPSQHVIKCNDFSENHQNTI